MSSIWSSTATQGGSGSPFATNGMAPAPGGGAAAKFQSMLPGQSSAKSPAGTASSPAASAAASSADSGDSGATITANDFLTLLVTEMQNQDPTAQTDPNEYINQLVQINSLEQLISINQNLSTVLGTTTSSAAPAASGSGVAAGATASTSSGTAAGNARNVASRTVSASGSKGNSVAGHSAPRAAPGNLSIPAESTAARATAHALDGRPNAARRGHAIRDIPTHSLP